MPTDPPRNETIEAKLERLRALARAGAEADARLAASWESQPDNGDEPDSEALKAALNAHRKATGERLLFPEGDSNHWKPNGR